MSYWNFQRRDVGCLSIHEQAAGSHEISDDLGELLYDDPMPWVIAQRHVLQLGGQLNDIADEGPAGTALVGAG